MRVSAEDRAWLRRKVLSIDLSNLDTRGYSPPEELKRWRVRGWYGTGIYNSGLSLVLHLWPDWASAIVRAYVNKITGKSRKVSEPRMNSMMRDALSRLHSAMSDDDVRLNLKEWRACTLFTALHTLGGPSPWTKHELVKDLRSWVSLGPSEYIPGKKGGVIYAPPGHGKSSAELLIEGALDTDKGMWDVARVKGEVDEGKIVFTNRIEWIPTLRMMGVKCVVCIAERKWLYRLLNIPRLQGKPWKSWYRELSKRRRDIVIREGTYLSDYMGTLSRRLGMTAGEEGINSLWSRENVRDEIEARWNDLDVSWGLQASQNNTRDDFDAYVDDVRLWATSGSAPGVKIGREKIRSKWVWAVQTIRTWGSISSWYWNGAADRDNIFPVAIKEEAGKTRLVVSAPMRSYLRQSFLLHVCGLPNIMSTINAPVEETGLVNRRNKWYGGVDASKFDHNFPLWIVRRFFSGLGRVCGSEFCRELADYEFSEIESGSCELFGLLVKYEKGLLSGWRVTSVLGSIVSHLSARYVCDKFVASVSSLVQGDDIVLWSQSKIPPSQVLYLFRRQGMDINASKCVFGPIGDFLRKYYSRDWAMGSASRAIRGLVYANPWIDSYTLNTAGSICRQWWLLCSRLIPWLGFGIVHKIVPMIKRDVAGWVRTDRRYTGKTPRDVMRKWLDYCTTPAVVGGSAPLEAYMLGYGRLCKSWATEIELPHGWSDAITGWARSDIGVVGVWGVLPKTDASRRHTSVARIGDNILEIGSVPVPPGLHSLLKGNIFKSTCVWLGSTLGNALKGDVFDFDKFPWPRQLYHARKLAKLSWLFKAKDVILGSMLSCSFYDLARELTPAYAVLQARSRVRRLQRGCRLINDYGLTALSYAGAVVYDLTTW